MQHMVDESVVDKLLRNGSLIRVETSKDIECQSFVVCGSWDSFDTCTKMGDRDVSYTEGCDALGLCKDVLW